MRPSLLLRYAESISARPLNPRSVSQSLLPPIPLYRALLRAHRKLPGEMRGLGDGYVKSEFRRHQTTTNPVHIMGFLSQWSMYLSELLQQSSSPSGVRGKKMDPTVFDKMSDEQVGQLWEVMHASRGVWKSMEELEREGRGEGADGFEHPPEGEGEGGKK
ncbi:ACN9-domain-containing protein [Calocera viscosa TUFC12733]|uniref:Succinate dehydrogenase assembly factor 3 n=1 Tax=Calocera viscosa (strain TUFC12733) TaxID=1330018 RepID=A0A167RFN4_CALVF|nr:ACN9-domain-containing protein [Calocera viscosa TUFC12733]